MNELTIWSAEPTDLQTIVDLRNEASDWLRRRGSDQWAGPPNRERLRRSIEAGETYVVWDDGQAAATITLDTHADPDFWKPEDRPHDALYVRQMIVARRFAGHDLGADLLDWAGDRARQVGKSWLRLDCWKTNSRLQDYYRRHGFTHLRTVDLPHRGSGALFQRPAATRT